MTDVIDFSNLAVIEIPVKIGSETYVLREATGKAAQAFQNALLQRTTFGPSGKPQKTERLGDLTTLLLSYCLFTQDNKPVAESVIASWPNRVVSELFDKAKQISKLEGEEETIEKLEKRIEELRTKQAREEEQGND